MNIFRYGMKMRPPAPGAVPKGFISFQSLDNADLSADNVTSFRWGTIDYPFCLGKTTEAQYELVFVGIIPMIDLAYAAGYLPYGHGVAILGELQKRGTNIDEAPFGKWVEFDMDGTKVRLREGKLKRREAQDRASSLRIRVGESPVSAPQDQYEIDVRASVERTLLSLDLSGCREITAKFGPRNGQCGHAIEVGMRVWFQPSTKAVFCDRCFREAHALREGKDIWEGRENRTVEETRWLKATGRI